MNSFKRNIFSIADLEEVVASHKDLATRSSQGYINTTNVNICLEPLTVSCRLATQSIGSITTGDVLYNSDGTTIFNGSNLYYNLTLQTFPAGQGNKVCFIDPNGVIAVHTICA